MATAEHGSADRRAIAHVDMTLATGTTALPVIAPKASQHALHRASGDRPGRAYAESDDRHHADVETAACVSASVAGSWQSRYRGGLVAIDLLVAALGSMIVSHGRYVTTRTGMARGWTELAVVVLVPSAWVAVVAAHRGYDRKFMGSGSIEFQRVSYAFGSLAVLVSFLALATRAEFARGFVLIELPLVLVLGCGARCVARHCLRRARSRGNALTPVLAVGTRASVEALAARLRRDPVGGMIVVGGCHSSSVSVNDSYAMTAVDTSVPVAGNVDAILNAAHACGARSVVVLSGELSPERLRWISWQLEGSGIDLHVALGMVGVGGARLHLDRVADVPLVHVDAPRFDGTQRTVKAVFDRIGAAGALLLLAPLFVVIIALIRVTSSGPAFFRQTRVGRDGRPFTMMKFRSMCVGAEAELSSLAGLNAMSDGPMFKIQNDPRVTRVGRFLRRTSLDELPQLFNVLAGSMSLVGPRPPLPCEVERYEFDVRRRLLVKPGITGLWQISGRSDLSWAETVRLDLRYVENWSIGTDLVILLKTVGTVIRPSGAY